jgi:hypothetical protein
MREPRVDISHGLSLFHRRNHSMKLSLVFMMSPTEFSGRIIDVLGLMLSSIRRRSPGNTALSLFLIICERM